MNATATPPMNAPPLEDIHSEYLLYVETMHGGTLRTLFEALKEMIQDVNLTFHEKRVGILKIDEGRTLLVYLKLHTDKFEDYYIAQPLVAGVQIQVLHKHLKTMANHDILRFYIHRETPNVLTMVLYNAEKGAMNKYNIDLMDINDEDLRIPELDFSFMITMNPSDFQKICRDLKSLGMEKVVIMYSKQRLSFTGVGEGSSIEIVRQPGRDKLDIMKKEGVDEHEIYHGEFELNKLCNFAKCTNLSNDVKLLLKNNYPIVFKYDAGDLGEIQLCLAPVVSTNYN